KQNGKCGASERAHGETSKYDSPSPLRGRYHNSKRPENGCSMRSNRLAFAKELTMVRRTILVVAAWGFAQAARAQDVEPGGTPVPAAGSAGAGEFLPFTLSSRVDSQRAFVTTLGGYDSARSTAIVQGQTEVNVWGPIAIRAGAVYTEQTGTLQPTFGAHVQVL